jgi:hypothetical protein
MVLSPIEKALQAGFEPLEPYPGNNRTAWLCRHITCGREVSLKLGGIVSGKNPCRYCNGQWIDPDMAVLNMRKAGLEPLEPYTSSKHPWPCRCTNCGNTVTPQYNSVMSNKSGCKYCGRKRGGNTRKIPAELAAAFMLANGLEPLEPYASSNAKWRCKCLDCGREVTTQYTQIKAGHGACRNCAGLFVEPDTAVEVMRTAGYEPLEPYVSSKHKWHCKCLRCGRETFPTYGEAKRGSRCKYCAGKALLPEEAVALMIANDFQPLELYPGAMKPWLCIHLPCGSEVRPRYAHVQQGRRACQKCSKALLAEQLRLNPEVAAEVMREAGLEPLEPYPGNHMPWRCVHVECGTEVTPTRASITQGQSGCRSCAQSKMALKFRTPDDEASSTMRAAGFEPLEPFPGRTNALWECRCLNCERTITPTLSNVKNGAKCIYCQKKRVDPNDAEVMMRRAGLEPLEPYPGKTKLSWKCIHIACGREVTTRYATVSQGNDGCVFCSGARIHEVDAVAMMRDRNLEPLEQFPGTNRRWKCTHLTCGKVVSPTYSNVMSGGTGCKTCSDSTFSYDAPGIIYLMHNADYAAIKIGITTTAARTNRIHEHQRSGWTLFARWDTPTGLDAEIIEEAILRWWRTELHVPVALRPEEMPTGGFTETAFISHVDVDETAFRIEELMLVSGIGLPGA